jgi:flavin-dependent dehydrogenase
MFDALVIGAGPAGATAARLLAAGGWRVALVETSQFPRRKVCGEFISAASLPVLESCGVADSFLAMAGPPVRQVGVYAGEVMLSSPRRAPIGRALGREHLDILMRDAAVAAGAQLRQPCELVSVVREHRSLACALQAGGRIAMEHARIVIAACGSWSAKGAFRPPRLHAPSDLLAFKAHFGNARLPAGLMPLLAFPGGYGGLVESDGGRLSLSCCIRREALEAARARYGGKAADAVIAHIRETTRGADAALDGAAPQGVMLAAGPVRPGIRRRYGQGIFFAGNSAGEAHPVIAEGISMAIQGSALLASTLLAAGPDGDMEQAGRRYARAWRLRFSPRIHAAALFAAAAMHGPSRAASLAMLRRFPGLIAWGAGISGKPMRRRPVP